MTHTVDDDLNPVWEDTGTFSYDKVRRDPLVFKVLDEDGPSKWDDVLGVAVLHYTKFWPRGTGEKFIELPLSLPSQFANKERDPSQPPPSLKIKIQCLQA